jgi:glutamine cyclotransferase
MHIQIKLIFISLLLTSVFSVYAQPLKNRESIPHFTKCYTQGLIIEDGTVWESCGKFGESHLIHWNLATQKIIKQVKFDDKYFAEGLTKLNGKLYMLTWRAGVAFEIDPDSLDTLKTFQYEGQGWGLTQNGKLLVLSNGSDILQFINPQTFKVEHKINVTINDKPVHQLNELEWIDGKIYANVFQTDYIVVIDPKTGVITDKHHLPNLLKNSFRKPGVLNGIAYDEVTKKTWITGKNWPLMFNL